jgi:uncharacterized membrane protein YgcG
MPVFKAMVTDPERILSHRQAGKLRREIKHFVRLFPQLRFHVALMPVAREIPLAAYAFWSFNGANLCSSLYKGGLNFHLLLLMDSEHERVNLSVGYGLEPFLPEGMLREMVAPGAPLLAEGAYGEAALAIIEESSRRLYAQSEAIPAIFGLRRKPREEGW